MSIPTLSTTGGGGVGVSFTRCVCTYMYLPYQPLEVVVLGVLSWCYGVYVYLPSQQLVVVLVEVVVVLWCVCALMYTYFSTTGGGGVGSMYV